MRNLRDFLPGISLFTIEILCFILVPHTTGIFNFIIKILAIVSFFCLILLTKKEFDDDIKSK